MRPQVALPGLAALFLCMPASARPMPDALDRAWQEVAGANRDAEPIRAAIRSVAARAGDQEPAPESVAQASRVVVLAAMQSCGVDALQAQDLAAAVEAELRAALADLPAASRLEPTIRIGPLDLTCGRIQSMLGSRDGRDRGDVVLKLEAAAHAQGVDLTDDDLLDLVPLMAAACGGIEAPDPLEPLRDAVASAWAQQ